MFERVAILKKLCGGREVNKWEDFPSLTRDRYKIIASLFPGYAVHACGSRVNGSYVDEDDGEERRVLRASLGKTNSVSDYDFIVHHSAIPLEPLPPWADRLKPHVSHGRIIEVPHG